VNGSTNGSRLSETLYDLSTALKRAQDVCQQSLQQGPSWLIKCLSGFIGIIHVTKQVIYMDYAHIGDWMTYEVSLLEGLITFNRFMRARRFLTHNESRQIDRHLQSIICQLKHKTKTKGVKLTDNHDSPARTHLESLKGNLQLVINHYPKHQPSVDAITTLLDFFLGDMPANVFLFSGSDAVTVWFNDGLLLQLSNDLPYPIDVLLTGILDHFNQKHKQYLEYCAETASLKLD